MGRKSKPKWCVKCGELVWNRNTKAKYCKLCSREVKTIFNKLRVRKTNAFKKGNFNLVEKINNEIERLQKQLLIKNEKKTA